VKTIDLLLEGFCSVCFSVWVCELAACCVSAEGPFESAEREEEEVEGEEEVESSSVLEDDREESETPADDFVEEALLHVDLDL